MGLLWEPVGGIKGHMFKILNIADASGCWEELRTGCGPAGPGSGSGKGKGQGRTQAGSHRDKKVLGFVGMIGLVAAMAGITGGFPPGD